ncbi:hypothetical protein [Halococcus thailandensis]|uniref:Uncharacterized protein n=1 Tax=Halococcus thailandensis JCM 13552 TaxID=1227457 RepID=M0MW65_9EURY|nr:hypothetical protein [Halococcus thailandensis]EMA48685.1 hypothetical protein C451_19993 [Halococcus thailandensis JCM 13552]
MIPVLGELAKVVGSFEQRIGVIFGGRVPIGEIAETSRVSKEIGVIGEHITEFVRLEAFWSEDVAERPRVS